MPDSPTKSSDSNAARWAQLRAVTTSREDAQTVLDEWRALWGERLGRAREPRTGRDGDWLIYADLRLDAPK